MSKYDKAAENAAKVTRAFVDTISVDDVRRLADKLGYELRRKGVKREKRKVEDADGNELRSTYFPHLTITATCYARTWKMLAEAQSVWGVPGSVPGDVWEHRLLLACEHILRYFKHNISEPQMLHAISRLVNPLPKSEYIKHTKNTKKKAK